MKKKNRSIYVQIWLKYLFSISIYFNIEKHIIIIIREKYALEAKNFGENSKSNSDI